MTETAYTDSFKANPLKTLGVKLSARFQSASPFKKSFIEGLLAGLAIFILLILWMALRADRTAESIQPLIPFEATEIIRNGEAPVAKAETTIPEPPATTQATAEETSPVVKADGPLPAAPVKGLSEVKDGLTLPMARFEDEMTPFQAYKRPFTAIAGRHLVSIVVVDFGLSATLSQSTLDTLPADVTVALTPYAEDAAEWGTKARAKGHEFWVSLPMQTNNAEDDTGPNTILVNAGLQQNQDRLLATMASAVGYAGLVSQKNHAYSSDDIDVAPMMKQIFGRGLGLTESNPNGSAFGEALAAKAGAPYVRNNFWLGDDLRPETIDRTLQAAELQASKQGNVVVFVQPYPVILKKIQEWIAEADQRGLQLAPLSAMAK